MRINVSHNITFSYTHIRKRKVEKVLILEIIFEIHILMYLHILRSAESENNICSCYSLGLSVCLFLQLAQKQIASETEISYFTFI